MLRRFLTIVAIAVVSASCAPKSGTPTAEEFKSANIEQSKASFKKMYQADLNASDVKVVSAKELGTWLKDGPWATRELPCEIQEILKDPGNVDPSPIALDVSSSSQQGGRLLYVPIRTKTSCDSPKSDFFLDDVAACEEKDKVMVCNGGIGGTCTCSCIFVCGATATDCNLC